VKKLYTVVLLLTTVSLLGSCAGRSVKSYRGQTPKFRPVQFFDGHLKAWGFAENRFGTINQRFEADFYGESHGDSVTMHEELRYADGRTLERDWTIKRLGEHKYSISANDMAGQGTGYAYGNAVRWSYYLPVSANGSRWVMHFDDWMILQDKKRMIDRAIISKYGITLGRAYLFFRKVSSDSEPSGTSTRSPKPNQRKTQ
jgi:hypothetical protein